jgi:hypothetical protein
VRPIFANIDGLPKVKSMNKVDFKRIDNDEHVKNVREIMHDNKGDE